MSWIDVSVGLEDAPIWPGNKKPIIETVQLNHYTVSSLCLNLHTGTHIDAPSHRIVDGKKISAMPLNLMISSGQIVSIHEKTISLQNMPEIHSDIVFFKTQNSMRKEFTPDYCYIEPDAAEHLVKLNIKMVGINYLSVENFYCSQGITHKILLENNVWILEGLNLENASEGFYEMIILPLNINAEAAPARVLVRRLEHTKTHLAEQR